MHILTPSQKLVTRHGETLKNMAMDVDDEVAPSTDIKEDAMEASVSTPVDEAASAPPYPAPESMAHRDISDSEEIGEVANLATGRWEGKRKRDVK